MAANLSIAGLRRQLLGRGLTLAPTCPMCRTQRQPDQFTREGVCLPCARRVLALRRIELLDLRLVGLWAASREETDPARLEAIDSEMDQLQGERDDLYWEEVADKSEFSQTGGE